MKLESEKEIVIVGRFKMTQNNFISRLFGLVIFIFLVSCSSSSSPVTSGLTGLTAKHANVSRSSNVCWGIWDVILDSETKTAEIVPLRTAAFNVNVTMFLQPPVAPVNLMSIKFNPATDFPNGYIDCDVTFQHPFKALPQFRGFDVRGIFMSDGSMAVESSAGLFRATKAEARLINADGYTRWWNPQEFGPEGKIFGFIKGKMGFPYYPSATLNPYKYYADALDSKSGVETLDISTRGTFATSPGANTRNYIIQFPVAAGMPDYRFQYAVDASWYPPDSSYAPAYPIEAFNESAQMREPYHILVSDEGSTAWYKDSGNKGGAIHLAIEIFDWQTPSTGMSQEIEALYVEAPLFGGPVDVLPMATQSPGSQPTSRIYSVVIDNLYLTHSGEEEILIAAQSTVGSYEPNLENPGPGWIYPDFPLTAYTVASVTILADNPNSPPVAVADKTAPLVGLVPLTVYLNPEGSYDPDEPFGDYITKYEWDIDADGTYEYQNTDGAVVDHIFTADGIYNIQLRVTDSFGATDLLDVPVKVEVKLEEDSWPMGFYDAGSTCYNPNSNVPPPLKLVYSADHPGNNLTQLVIARGHIYLTDSNGYLRCLDADNGSQIWAQNVGQVGSWWTGISAAIWNDNVIMGGSGVWSFNADTGAVNWHIAEGLAFAHQGMVIVKDTVYIRSTSGTYRSLNALDGSQNWSVGWNTFPLMPTAYGESGGQGYCVAPSGYSERCLRASDGMLVWSQDCGTDAFGNVIVLGEYAYFGGTTIYKKHLATGVNAATYNLVNHQPLGMCISNDRIFFVVRLTSSPYSHKLMAFDFDLGFKWETPILTNNNHPVFSGGYLWLVAGPSDSQKMTAYDPITGAVAYQYPDPVGIGWGGISNVGNRLYYTNNNGKLFVFEHAD